MIPREARMPKCEVNSPQDFDRVCRIPASFSKNSNMVKSTMALNIERGMNIKMTMLACWIDWVEILRGRTKIKKKNGERINAPSKEHPSTRPKNFPTAENASPKVAGLFMVKQ